LRRIGAPAAFILGIVGLVLMSLWELSAMRTAVGIVILVWALSVSPLLVRQLAAEEEPISFTYDQKTGVTQIISPHGIVIEVEGDEETFNANLNSLSADKVQLRKFIVNEPLELGEFCRDLSSILDCTVVVPANLRKLIVPECTLRRVNLPLALNTVAESANGQFQIQIGDTTDVPIRSGDVVIRVTDARSGPEDASIVGRIFRLPPVAKDNPRPLEESLDEILELTKSAIETLATAKGHPVQKLPSIKMHPQSHILIVAGTVEEIEIVGSVVTALGGEVVEVPKIRESSPMQQMMQGFMGGGGGMGGGGMGGGGGGFH
jgi:hypothetical protein